jgi:predicted cation transporter
VKKVEDNLELFLFAMGVIAVTASSRWTWPLVREAFLEPIMICAAVLVAGLLFRLFRPAVRKAVRAASSALGMKAFAFAVVVAMGIVTSLITSIIAALLLALVIDAVKLDRKDEIKIVVIACYAIGISAILTPLGGPLATIVIAKLQGEPYDASFWFLFVKFWPYIIPGILGFGALAAILVNGGPEGETLKEDHGETFGDIFASTAKTYIFIMALVFLGTGFKPIIDAYIPELPAAGLFWLNSLSAILDNATLAAAEVSPGMKTDQLTYALVGLIVAGGMLIPGNIANIISAGRLKIGTREWMAVGIPVGIVAMLIYFAVLSVFAA